MRHPIALVVTVACLSGTALAQPPGFDPAAFAKSRFERYDKNRDGRITRDEVSGERFESEFDAADANRDGSVTADEFQTHFTSRMASFRSRGMGGPPPGVGAPPSTTTTTVVVDGPPGTATATTYSPPPVSYGDSGRDRRSAAATKAEAKETPKPFVARYGNQPKGTPSWFTDLDGDQDGMIGLYEWRRDKRPISEFAKMDLNGDGYLTGDEYLRYELARIESQPDATAGSVARLRGEPIERGSRAEAPAEARTTENASTERRTRGQRAPATGDAARNPFIGR